MPGCTPCCAMAWGGCGGWSNAAILPPLKSACGACGGHSRGKPSSPLEHPPENILCIFLVLHILPSQAASTAPCSRACVGNPKEQQSFAQPKRLVARLAVSWPKARKKDEFSASSQLNLEGGGGAKLKKGYFVFRAATSTPRVVFLGSGNP